MVTTGQAQSASLGYSPLPSTSYSCPSTLCSSSRTARGSRSLRRERTGVDDHPDPSGRGPARGLSGPAATPASGQPLYAFLRWGSVIIFGAVLLALVITIASSSSQAFAHSGLKFLWTGTWDPSDGLYATGTLVVGTVVTTIVAMVLVVPIGLGISTYLSEFVPSWLAVPLTTAIEFLAAIPSIVVGLWPFGASPVFGSTVEPFLERIPVLGWFFHGPAYGPSIVLASVVLAIMTLPTVVALSRSALSSVPVEDREAALALGATKWQVIHRSVLPGARSGIAAAVTLAIGRALGESIAVALVIGNRPAIPHSLLAPGATLGSTIVDQFAESTTGLESSAVIGLAAVLLILTVVVNIGGQMLNAGPWIAPLPGGGGGDHMTLPPASTVARVETGVPAWATPEAIEIRRRRVRDAADRTLGRRRLWGRIMKVLCMVAVVVGLAPLVAMLWATIARGASIVNVAFLTNPPTPEGVPGGGISTAIIGSAEIVGLALLIAIPLGLFVALFLHERPGRLASSVRFGADVLAGVPSIIIGIFAYAVLVRPLHHASTLAAGFAVAVLMIPIMIRANEEAMRSVPVDLWEAGVSLGIRRSRVARSIVLRAPFPDWSAAICWPSPAPWAKPPRSSLRWRPLRWP